MLLFTEKPLFYSKVQTKHDSTPITHLPLSRFRSSLKNFHNKKSTKDMILSLLFIPLPRHVETLLYLIFTVQIS